MKLIDHGVFYSGGKILDTFAAEPKEAKNRTMAYQIMHDHSSNSEDGTFRIRFDAMHRSVSVNFRSCHSGETTTLSLLSIMP